MLREATVHVDWGEKTMSMLREKQFEACERRLNAHPSIGLFSPEATSQEVQELWECSYYRQEMPTALADLEGLREQVFKQLPLEVRYLSQGESALLERLLICNGSIELGEWDDIGAAEALVSRLWCSFRALEDVWILELPGTLHVPMLTAMDCPEYSVAREILFRYEAMMMGLLYITGFLHSDQPIDLFLQDVTRSQSEQCKHFARRYLQSTFEYMLDRHQELILLHPGLADPYRLISAMGNDAFFTMELSQTILSGGMNGIFPEEESLHQDMCGALANRLRPECDVTEAAEDLRMLVKQGVSLEELQEVMASMLCVLPTEEMKAALVQLHQRTPHWVGLKTSLQH